ncbi:hypothetical protein [Parvularcula marina]|uniref:hypothetical protein n=1 Tax=Parvularcula marina TaxID=2292771 RepID=UPI003514CDEE
MSLLSSSLLVSLLALGAQPSDDFAPPCEKAPYTQFDMWVGEWVAFDWETGVVQGIDRIRKINNDCVIHQEWQQMTDRYRTAGAPYRYGGISFSYPLPGGGWKQVWLGNGGWPIELTGKLDEDGVMTLSTAEFDTPDGKIGKRTWRWARQEDGSLHSWGEFVSKDPEGEWSAPQIVWNLRYVRHADAPELGAVSQ